jgi:hypothetical protein
MFFAKIASSVVKRKNHNLYAVLQSMSYVVYTVCFQCKHGYAQLFNEFGEALRTSRGEYSGICISLSMPDRTIGFVLDYNNINA